MPLAINISPSTIPLTFVCVYSNGVDNTLKNLLTTRSNIFLSFSLKFPINTLYSVGIIAWWSVTFVSSTKDLFAFIFDLSSLLQTLE